VIRRLCIVGTGLIGGSLARDLRRLGEVGEVVGSSRHAANLERAVDLGVIDRFDVDVARAVTGADMVVVAVPLGAISGVFERIRDAVDDDAVITDVGSAKSSVVAAARSVLGLRLSQFVPGHPIAGTEHFGVDASTERLFERRRVILTPTAETSGIAVERVSDMWRLVGSEVIEMDVNRHDEVLAATSHLPHMLAYTLVDVLGGMKERAEIFRLSAGGLRDFTRIASSDPQMWQDICLANREAMVDAIERFGSELGQLTDAIRRGDGEFVRLVFTRAKSVRDTYF
jgi:prephenate dehydrogenase